MEKERKGRKQGQGARQLEKDFEFYTLLVTGSTLCYWRVRRRVRRSHCHVFLGGLDPGQAPLKTLSLMPRLAQVFLSLF